MCKLIILVTTVACVVRNVTTGSITVRESFDVHIKCDGDTLDDIKPLDTPVYADQRLLSVDSCPPPIGSTYNSTLQRLKIVSQRAWMNVYNVTREPLLQEYFTGLFLRNLLIHNIGYEYQVLDVQDTSDGVEIADLSMGNNIRFMCRTSDTLADLLPVSLKSPVRVTDVGIFCSLPKNSFEDALRALNVDPTFISSMVLRDLPPNSKLQFQHLQNLSLRILEIHAESPYRFKADPNFLDALPELKELTVQWGELPSLPTSNRLEKVTFLDGVSLREFGGCKSLEILEMMRWEISQSENVWLKECRGMKELSLVQMSTQAVLRVLENSTITVQKVSVNECAMSFLSTDTFKTIKGLRYLDLSGNFLVELEGMSFNVHPELNELDLSRNNINRWDYVSDSLAYLNDLQVLNLADNKLSNMCQQRPLEENVKGSIPVYQLKVKYLFIQNSEIPEICFKDWKHLQHLHLTHSNITELDLTELPSPNESNVTINLQNNPIKTLLREHRTESQQYDMMMAKYKNVTHDSNIILNITIDCDCKHAWFARALKNLPRLHLTGARCKNGEDIGKADVVGMECNKTECVPGCTCRRGWRDGMISIDCSGAALDTIPTAANLTKLHMPNNKVVLIDADLPETLVDIDVSNNRIARVSAEAASALFAVSERRVRLAGNPLLCDCGNFYFLVALQEHHIQVEDYDNITCVGTGLSLQQLDTSELCRTDPQSALLTAASVAGALIVLTLILILLYRRYAQALKVYLFSRGLCLSCLTEEEIDSDRLYDAFVSFSHKDETFVLEQFLPKLENDPRGYKLCLHYRDWVVGESIPWQIGRSVVNSRRTIIILSKNFLKSVWGLLEFRTAHVSALKEGRMRIIMVVIDDVTMSHDLDIELSNYLSNTTYIKWGDPKFWDKLSYALPHYPLSGNTIYEQVPISDDSV